MTALDILTVLLSAAAGGGVGWFYFFLMKKSVASLGVPSGKMRFAGLAALRVVVLAAGLFGTLLYGAWPFAAFTVGFFITRTVVVLRARDEAVAGAGLDSKEDTGARP